MLEIEFRRGTTEDASIITDLIKKMVTEMANYGGHSVNNSPDAWTSMESEVRANSARQENVYLIAIQASATPAVVGIATANIESLENIFVPKRRLHIGAIYTIPNARRHGVARQLLQYILEWGQQMNVSEIDLNVLVANPARYLYEQFGFEPHEISMTRKLESQC